MSEHHAVETAAPHPEEMRATVELTIGRSVSFKASARATPAGLAAAALLVSAATASAIWAWRRAGSGREA